MKTWPNKMQYAAKVILKRKVHSDTSLPQEMRKISNNLTIPKGSRRRRANEAQR